MEIVIIGLEVIQKNTLNIKLRILEFFGLKYLIKMFKNFITKMHTIFI